MNKTDVVKLDNSNMLAVNNKWGRKQERIVVTRIRVWQIHGGWKFTLLKAVEGKRENFRWLIIVNQPKPFCEYWKMLLNCHITQMFSSDTSGFLSIMFFVLSKTEINLTGQLNCSWYRWVKTRRSICKTKNVILSIDASTMSPKAPQAGTELHCLKLWVQKRF